MKLRIKILQAAAFSIHLRVLCLTASARALGRFVDLVCLAVKFQKRREFNRFKSDCQKCTERLVLVQSKLPFRGILQNEEKAKLLTEVSLLRIRLERLKGRSSTITVSRPLTAVALLYLADELQYSLSNVGNKNESLTAIIRNASSSTFYCDVFLWLVVPGTHSVELFGDLTEEYLLRKSADGETSAKVWYRHQVTTSISNCLWKRIERIAAIAFLIETIRWWFRR